jgi:DNA-directed RNA polymerase specialized sigma subunit
MNARDFLNQVKRIEEAIQYKLEEIAQLKNIALGVASVGCRVVIEGEEHILEKVQSSGSQQRMADAICKYIDIEKEINNDIDLLLEKKNEVLAVISQLEKPIQYNVLRKKYFQFKNLKSIAEEMSYTYQYILEVHSEALKNVQKILEK